MLDRLIARLPDGWRELMELLTAPIVWIPRLQQLLVGFFSESSSSWMSAAKYVVLLFPLLLGIAAIWCTQLSLYTLPFRAGRTRFISLMLLAWWDAAWAVWTYWVGLVRLAGVVIGWCLALANLFVRCATGLARLVATTPFAVTGGRPWMALAMLVFWCVLEAAVFAYTLFPTVTQALTELVGMDEPARLTGPLLYAALLLLIMGSFAGVQMFVDALRKGETRFLAQIVLVELIVMSVEVMFLYRQLVGMMMPWLAQQTAARTAFGLTLAGGALGWVGIRSMTWFLFGRYGTPSLLAFISRRPVAPSAAEEMASMPGAWWRPALADFKREIAWLHDKSEQVLEYLALPVLHVIAAALNFAMILTSARPVFNLPFRGFREVTEARDAFAAMHLQPRKQVSL